MTFLSVLGGFPSFRNVLFFSAILRIGLIVYSEWHDANSVVKYTDVDYRVFSDAARFILNPSAEKSAKGPLARWLKLSLGDPYTRATYRYTPLLALLVMPNEWIHPSFGKYVFALCDIINGLLIYDLLVSVILPSIEACQIKSEVPQQPKEISNVQHIGVQNDTAHPNPTIVTETLATFYTAVHLLNPLVFSISTRGSSESVLSLFVLLTLYYALTGRWGKAAVMLGLSTHWKVYPVVYGVSCLGIVGQRKANEEGGVYGWKGYISSIVNWRTLRFALISTGTFLSLGLICYSIWGYPFIYESYLYHLHRRDHRHNFSPYFYMTYLTYPSVVKSSDLPLPSPSLWTQVLQSPLTSFAPQMILTLGTGLVFGRRKDDLIFAWFVQTAVFVLFNKVCTSQYFLWYLLLLPLLLPRLSISPLRSIAYLAVWVGTQAIWLLEAYRLEFLGQNVFYGLWVRSLIYLLGNCWVLAGIMNGYT